MSRVPHRPSPKPQRLAGGEATTKLVVSAMVGDNAALFPKILDLHVPAGSVIADVTFGKGVFWKGVTPERYVVLASDLWAKANPRVAGVSEVRHGVDCRALPYQDGSIDCVVLDPPYMEGLHRARLDHLAGNGSHAAFRSHYSSGTASPAGPRWHEAVIDLYLKAGAEAYRVLRREGILIVKCQDEVSANRQRLTHVEIISGYEPLGFYTKDLFVLVRTNRPGVSRIKKQEHARKAHSYFLVFQKRKINVSSVVSRRRG
jgi:hypothetical protein